MISTNLEQRSKVLNDRMQVVVVEPVSELEILASKLSPENSWGERQSAAQKLGNLRNRASLPILLAALPGDPFWMVRCAMIQALESIGAPEAIPVLMDVLENDSFAIVRSYAANAVDYLSRGK